MGRISLMIYGGLAALIFCGYIIYDTDNLIKRYSYDEYIWAAVALYLDIINLFLSMLTLFRAADTWVETNINVQKVNGLLAIYFAMASCVNVFTFNERVGWLLCLLCMFLDHFNMCKYIHCQCLTWINSLSLSLSEK